MAHCTQLCTTKNIFYLQQNKFFFLGITLFDTFSLLFQKEKNLMSLFLIACNRGLSIIHQKTNFHFPYVRFLSLRRVSHIEQKRLIMTQGLNEYIRSVLSTPAVAQGSPVKYCSLTASSEVSQTQLVPSLLPPTSRNKMYVRRTRRFFNSK